MTMTSPEHALAYAHICDLMRTAARDRQVARPPRRRSLRSAGAAALRWLRRGQLGVVNPCTDC